MKSFLQKIGVITEDTSAVPVAEVLTSVAATPTPSTFSSLVQQGISDVGVTDVAVKTDPQKIEAVKETCYADLQVLPSLTDLYKFLEASSKLSKVADIKVRFQATLDVTGQTADSVIKSASMYAGEVDTLTKKYTGALSTSASALEVEQIQGNLKDVISKKAGLQAEMEDLCKIQEAYDISLANAQVAVQKETAETTSALAQIKTEGANVVAQINQNIGQV